MVTARTLRFPRSAASVLGLAVIAVLVVMMVFVWLQVARTLKSARPAPPIAAPTSLVWGKRVFQTEAQLKRWVEERGLSYAGWAAHHQGAVAVIEHRAAIQPRPAQGKEPKAVAATVRARSKASRVPSMDGLLGGIGWTLALLLGAVAFLPRRLVVRFSRREFGVERRVAVAAAALAVGLGLVAGSAF